MKVHRIAAFTKDSRGGNPAGVVLAETLPDATEMQRIATEVGYSETVFSAPEDGSWRTRYFSPQSEVAFCGHATIALGAVLASEKGAARFDLKLNSGNIEVAAGVQEGVARSTLRSPPTKSFTPSQKVIDEALILFGYSPGELDPELSPMIVNAGNDHLLLSLRTREQLRSMHYDIETGRDFMRHHGFVTIVLVWRESERLFHARNAFASGGVLEDPATGAAAAALAGMLRDQEMLADGELTIIQGEDMGFPSRIEVRFEKPNGSPVHVSGMTRVIPEP
jgi:PhzF family phenazine biosynthesis protein